MTLSSEKVAIALVGGGTIAPLHAQYLLSSSTCTLIALIDPFPPGQKLALQLGVSHFTSIEDLLASTSKIPDAYIICVPSSLHVQVTEDILRSASPKAILVEKPFCTDSKSGEQILELAQQKSCQLLVGHHRRFHPAVERARQVIERGEIGKVTAISGFWTTKKNDGYFTFADWRCSRSAGGGPIWTNFVHDIDVLHYLTGSRVARVWAIETASRRAHRNIQSSDLVEEGAAVMLQFANGLVGTVIVNDNVASPFGWEAATGDNPLYPTAPAQVDSYRIFGAEGTLTEPDGTLWKYDTEQATKLGKELGWNVPMQRQELESSNGIPFQQQAEHLAKVVRGEESPRCSGEDGLNAVRVCEAVIAALEAKDGLPIDLQ
jgi:predicted dehydrogenase